MLKYSRQRESIKSYLSCCHTHPTADAVYLAIREQYPNISLGTVYRNLSLLASLGEIRKISCGDGADRFDGDLRPHSHVVCTCCGIVQDLPGQPSESLMEFAESHYAGKIFGFQTIFQGICPDCLKEKGAASQGTAEQ